MEHAPSQIDRDATHDIVANRIDLRNHFSRWGAAGAS
jgi:hypothetical protein